MSDSDSDGLLSNNVYGFRTENTVVSAKGPNINMSNITGLSFRNNVFSSTQIPRHYERQRYAESNYDQYSRDQRDTSPMSIRSAGDMKPRNYNHSFNPQGIFAFNAPRSAFNRGGSPMSVRTIDTTASVSAVDIANALKNEHFNIYELKVIKDAYNRFVKHKVRKKMEKRKYRKIHRRKSGYDSGEQGSNSSLSSDDRSVRTTSYRDNMSSCRSTITDISNFKRKINHSNMFRNCTTNFNQNSIHSAGRQPWSSAQSISSYRSMPAGSNMPQFQNVPAKVNRIHEKTTASVMTLKDRFKSGYQLPSQRFNKSLIPSSMPEIIEKEHDQINSQNERNKESERNNDIASDDEIFSNIPNQKEPKKANRKRSLDCEDNILPKEKKFKTLSPCKNSIDVRKQKTCDDKSNDFIFAIPMGPARKSIKEKLISKSAAPLLDTAPQVIKLPKNIQSSQENPVEEEKLSDQSNSTCNSSSLSMRPSFIKRKLFSQKLDVSEKKNQSIENINSPESSMYHTIQKEKHKTRKLQQATTQSCLSREIQPDESNLLDLINKIVPIDQINVTNHNNKTGSQSKNLTNLTEEDDKWDITSIISTRKNDDESDTYTDEEILNATVKELERQDKLKSIPLNENEKNKVKKNAIKKSPSPVKSKICKIVIEKLPPAIKQTTIRQFWDTDFESDVECLPSPKKQKLNPKENKNSDVLQPMEIPKKHITDKLSRKKPTTAPVPVIQNYTFDTTQKFNNTLKIKSHRAPKRNKLDQVTDGKAISALLAMENKQKTLTKVEKHSKKSNNPDTKPTSAENKKPREIVIEKDKKSPKSKTTKTDKLYQSIHKPTTKKHSTKSEEQTNKKDNNTKKVKSSKKQDKENKTPTKKSNNEEKIAEAKLSNKSPNTRATKKATSESNTPVIEENNKPNRAIRSCRKNPKNQFANQSNTSLNNTTNRTLRSRKLDLSSVSVKNDTKSVQKDIKSYMITRLSSASLSPAIEKNLVVKRALAKNSNTRDLIADESDVSFSLTSTPRKTRSSSRNNTLNTTPLSKTSLYMKDLPLSNCRSSRQRFQNKRFIY